jgi:hypothetical protein
MLDWAVPHFDEMEETMPEGALLSRHRDKNGEIGKKHGNTLVSTLRRIYGRNFAPNCDDHEKLSDVLHKLDETSLNQMVADHTTGILAKTLHNRP